MSSLKQQQKKLLRTEIACRSMEYLVGLNEEHQSVIRELAEKSAKKMVNAYHKAIKAQHKAALKESVKTHAVPEVPSIAETVDLNGQFNLKAS